MTVVPVMREPEQAVAAVLERNGASGPVTAVYVIEVSPLLPLDAELGAEEEHAKRFLRRAVSAGAARGVRVIPRLVRARDAGAVLRGLGAL